MGVSQRPPLPKRGDANLGLFCSAVMVVLVTMLFLSVKQEQKKARRTLPNLRQELLAGVKLEIRARIRY